METLQAIATRKSTRNFNGKPIPHELVSRVAKAGLYAPTGMRQFDSLRITVVEDKELLRRINDIPELGLHDPLHGAPALIIVSSTDEGARYQNSACMIENMMLAATDLGLSSLYIMCIIPAIAQDKELLKALHIPGDMLPVGSAAIGYTDDPVTMRTAPFNDKTVVEYIR